MCACVCVCVFVSGCQLESLQCGQSDRRMDVLSLRRGEVMPAEWWPLRRIYAYMSCVCVSSCTLGRKLQCASICAVELTPDDISHTPFCQQNVVQKGWERGRERLRGGNHPPVLSLLDSVHRSNHRGCIYCNWNIDTFNVSGSIFSLGVHGFVFRMVGREKGIKNEGGMDAGHNIMAQPCIIPQFYDKYLMKPPQGWWKPIFN